MKVIVLCDSHGKLISVAMPNPDLEGQVGLSLEPAISEGSIHELNVDGDLISKEALLGPEESEDRKKAFEALQRMLPKK